MKTTILSRTNVEKKVQNLLEKNRDLEKALLYSEFKYRELADSMPQTVFEMDLNGNLTYANDNAFRSTGYSLEDIRDGLNVQRLFIPQDRLRVKENIKKIINGDKTSGQEYTAVRKDGSEYPVLIFSTPVFNDDKVIGLRGIVVDISERKRFEEMVRQSEEKYRALFEQKLDGVIVFDENMKILLANDAAAEIFGFDSVEELYRINILDYVALDERDHVFQVNLKNMFESNPQRENQIRCKKKTGAEMWIGVVGSRIKYHGKAAGIASFRDITVQKRGEEELRRSREELHNLYLHSHMVREEERTLIAHEIHDQLGQDLTALKMDLFWLYKRLPKEQKQLFEKVKEMSGLVSETISTVQKISSKLRPAILDDLGIAAAIEWQIAEFQKHTGIACDFRQNGENFPLTRECSTAVFRIVQETLTNVARHAKATKVTINLSHENGKLLLRVKDDGKGITREQIHSPYSYGLLGMRERARAFGGEFEIIGFPKKGTFVTVSIPFYRSGGALDEKDIGG